MKNFAMVFTLFFCSLMLFLSVSLNISDDPANLQQLKNTNECVDCNLKGASLIGADLEGANLEDASLVLANLEDAYLDGTKLCNTTMPDGSVIYSGC